MSELGTATTPLPPPQGYVAEKVSILMGALRAALKRFGLVVQTVDDSIPPSQQVNMTAAAVDTPTSTSASSPSPRTYSGSMDHVGPLKFPGLHSLGEPIERMLQDAAEFHDSRAVQVAHEAIEDERLNKNRLTL